MPTYQVLFSLLLALPAAAQITTFPYRQDFDSVSAPELPPGWSGSTTRVSSGDFTTTPSSPFSPPNAALSTNSLLPQHLESPPFDFSGKEADSIVFFERRSGTHLSGVLLEYSSDAGQSYPVQADDTLGHPGTSGYVRRAFKLPSILNNASRGRIRLRIIGNGGGSTGTIRIDDVVVNALSPHDVGVVGLRPMQLRPRAGETILLNAVVRNFGTSPASRMTIELFEDVDDDTIPDGEEFISATLVEMELGRGDTAAVSLSYHARSPGAIPLIARAVMEGDQSPGNDAARIILPIGAERSSVIINEIMYDPLPGESEFVELLNLGTGTIELQDWIIADTPDTSVASGNRTISRKSIHLPPSSYLVLASDSAILRQYPYLQDSAHRLAVLPAGLGLNNTGEPLILRDLVLGVVDSLNYLPSWHNPDVEETRGRSLERLHASMPGADERNWSTSASPLGGTPGKPNSLSVSNVEGKGDLTCSPNPFSPDGDGHEDHCLIVYRVPMTVTVIRVVIYDAAGRPVRHLADHEPGGSRGELLWDGYNDRKERGRIGIYVILFEAYDSWNRNVLTMKGRVVLAARL